MPTLTSDQAFQLSSWFRDVAVEVENYRFANWDILTPGQRTKLENLEFSIRNYSSDFNALSIKIAVDDLAGTLQNIQTATDQMKEAIKNLNNINKLLNIAAATVTLGAAILSGNAAGIVSAVGGTVTAINS